MYTFDKTSGDWLTRSREIDKLIVESRRLRAEAIARTVVGAARGAITMAGWLTNRLQQWNERRALTAELTAMTDHELRDIGLTRGDIEAVAAGRCRGERGIRRRPLLMRLNPGIRRIPVDIIRTDRAA